MKRKCFFFYINLRKFTEIIKKVFLGNIWDFVRL